MDLKVGDIVKLKIGGQTMVVNRVGPYGQPDDEDYLQTADEVQTIWFTPDGEGGWFGPFSDIFGVATLEKVDGTAEQEKAA